MNRRFLTRISLLCVLYAPIVSLIVFSPAAGEV